MFSFLKSASNLLNPRGGYFIPFSVLETTIPLSYTSFSITNCCMMRCFHSVTCLLILCMSPMGIEGSTKHVWPPPPSCCLHRAELESVYAQLTFRYLNRLSHNPRRGSSEAPLFDCDIYAWCAIVLGATMHGPCKYCSAPILWLSLWQKQKWFSAGEVLEVSVQNVCNLMLPYVRVYAQFKI